MYPLVVPSHVCMDDDIHVHIILYAEDLIGMLVHVFPGHEVKAYLHFSRAIIHKVL